MCIQCLEYISEGVEYKRAWICPCCKSNIPLHFANGWPMCDPFIERLVGAVMMCSDPKELNAIQCKACGPNNENRNPGTPENKSKESGSPRCGVEPSISEYQTIESTAPGCHEIESGKPGNFAIVPATSEYQPIDPRELAYQSMGSGTFENNTIEAGCERTECNSEPTEDSSIHPEISAGTASESDRTSESMKQSHMPRTSSKQSLGFPAITKSSQSESQTETEETLKPQTAQSHGSPTNSTLSQEKSSLTAAQSPESQTESSQPLDLIQISIESHESDLTTSQTYESKMTHSVTVESAPALSLRSQTTPLQLIGSQATKPETAPSQLLKSLPAKPESTGSQTEPSQFNGIQTTTTGSLESRTTQLQESYGFEATLSTQMPFPQSPKSQATHLQSLPEYTDSLTTQAQWHELRKALSALTESTWSQSTPQHSEKSRMTESFGFQNTPSHLNESEAATNESLGSQMTYLQSIESQITPILSIESLSIHTDSIESVTKPVHSLSSQMPFSQSQLESQDTHSQTSPEFLESSTTHTAPLKSQTELSQSSILVVPCQAEPLSTDNRVETQTVNRPNSLCLQFNQDFCPTCAYKHVHTTASKSLQLSADRASMNIADWMRIFNQDLDKCDVHQSEKRSMFCEQCSCWGCSLCLKEHEKHPCRNLESIFSEKRQQLHHDRILLGDLMKFSLSYIEDQNVAEILDAREKAFTFYCSAIYEYGSFSEVFQMHANLRMLLKITIGCSPGDWKDRPDLKTRLTAFASTLGEYRYVINVNVNARHTH